MKAASARVSDVVERLRRAGCVAAEEEADELVAAAPDGPTLEAWIDQREDGVPLAWIVGYLDFCGHRVRVDHGVYVPRMQSEELARRAAATLPDHDGRALDLCCGAGAVAVHLAAAGADVVGVDIDRAAATCARRNAVPAVVGDLAEPIGGRGDFDLVTAVAPYVPTAEISYLPADVQRYEPRVALDGGADGLAIVGRVIAAAARLLRVGGWLFTELGGEQDATVSSLLGGSGFGSPTRWFDEDDDLRGIGAQFLG